MGLNIVDVNVFIQRLQTFFFLLLSRFFERFKNIFEHLFTSMLDIRLLTLYFAAIYIDVVVDTSQMIAKLESIFVANRLSLIAP